jgi:hypothetical protein
MDVIVLWTGKLALVPGLLDLVDRDFAPVATFGTAGKGTPRGVYRERGEDDD